MKYLIMLFILCYGLGAYDGSKDKDADEFVLTYAKDAFVWDIHHSDTTFKNVYIIKHPEFANGCITFLTLDTLRIQMCSQYYIINNYYRLTKKTPPEDKKIRNKKIVHNYYRKTKGK